MSTISEFSQVPHLVLPFTRYKNLVINTRSDYRQIAAISANHVHNTTTKYR